jgi:hypothetical protein
LYNTTTYAKFSHWNKRTSSTDYAIIQSSGGTTYLNGASGTTVGIRIANVDELTINASSISAKDKRIRDGVSASLGDDFAIKNDI